MEQFLANLKIILPVVGLDLLKPQPRAVAQVSTPVEQRTVSDVKFEIRHKSGIYANAVEEDGEFIVLEGSRALTNQGYVMQSYAALKQNLINTGVLVPAQQDRLTGYTESHISHGRRDLSERGFAGSGAQMLPAGSVLFSSRAPIGYCVIASNEVSTILSNDTSIIMEISQSQRNSQCPKDLHRESAARCDLTMPPMTGGCFRPSRHDDTQTKCRGTDFGFSDSRDCASAIGPARSP